MFAAIVAVCVGVPAVALSVMVIVTALTRDDFELDNDWERDYHQP